jgi:hypothetical protein
MPFDLDLLGFAVAFAAGMAAGVLGLATLDAVLDEAKALGKPKPDPLTQDDPATLSILRFGRMRDETGER